MAGFSRSRFLLQKLVFLVHSVSVYLRLLFSFIAFYIFRLQGDAALNKSQKKETIDFAEAEHDLSTEPNKDDKGDTAESNDFNEESEKEEEEMCLKFKFPTYEEFIRTAGKRFNGNSEVVPSSASTTKYELTSGKSVISAFIDEMETFPVREFNASNKIEEGVCFSDENIVEGICSDNRSVIIDKGKEVSEEISEGEILEFEENSEEKGKGIQGSDEVQFFSEKKSVISDSESTSFKHMNPLMDSYSDGFLSDGDFVGELEINDEDEHIETESELSGFEENHDLSEEDFDDEESNIMEELRKLEEDNNQNPNGDFLSVRDFNDDSDNIHDAEFVTKDDDKDAFGGDDKTEKQKLKDSSLSESEDANELESLWEHQELIEQLKMELKKVRATGLPTILEESESPKIMDDLKPWKIDESKREDHIAELHKFYKSYRERMRKFDIVNYQKMYAMGFLQLKDPLRSIPQQKPSPPTLKSLVSQNIWLFKHKIHGSDPMKKFIRELQGDLEAVYVGQMCLSWEFLHWQYDKALDLWDSDPRGVRMYNEVAGEFQQFQVLVQRFVEDEPFQGPRVQNYVKSRCAVRNLLQVPVIREDNYSKEKRKARLKDEDDYVITSDMLVEIVEESIRIFWRFVRADKDCSTSSFDGHKKIELPNPDDLKLLMEIKKDLQKKEKKLKDLLRTENCILRKFRQCREDDDSVLYFFSQVDMKLVCRVLNMSKVTRDQLMWCHSKLDRISFVNRKIHVEPAFLLFPC